MSDVCVSSEGQRGSHRRSPLDVIMSQIRRKRTERRPPRRFLSQTSDHTGIPEDGEMEAREERGKSAGEEEEFWLVTGELLTFGWRS